MKLSEEEKKAIEKALWYFQEVLIHEDDMDCNYISKDKIREIKQSIHNTLDENGITRGYQLKIDKYFDELLEENNND